MHGNITHGHTAGGKTSPTHKSWEAMKQRVLNPNHISFKYYGGRGIKIDPRWLVFENFLEDMGVRPVGTSLDRIDSNGDYEYDNCKWSSATEQANNRSNSGPLGLCA